MTWSALTPARGLRRPPCFFCAVACNTSATGYPDKMGEVTKEAIIVLLVKQTLTKDDIQMHLVTLRDATLMKAKYNGDTLLVTLNNYPSIEGFFHEFLTLLKNTEGVPHKAWEYPYFTGTFADDQPFVRFAFEISLDTFDKLKTNDRFNYNLIEPGKNFSDGIYRYMFVRSDENYYVVPKVYLDKVGVTPTKLGMTIKNELGADDTTVFGYPTLTPQVETPPGSDIDDAGDVDGLADILEFIKSKNSDKLRPPADKPLEPGPGTSSLVPLRRSVIDTSFGTPKAAAAPPFVASPVPALSAAIQPIAASIAPLAPPAVPAPPAPLAPLASARVEEALGRPAKAADEKLMDAGQVAGLGAAAFAIAALGFLSAL